jgi:prepilin-type N-terminal cleavage/methylation domain-containing protein
MEVESRTGFTPHQFLQNMYLKKIKIVIPKRVYLKSSLVETGAGFTLIELIVVMAIFLIAGGFGLVLSMDSYRSYNFREQQNLLVGLLQKARSESMENINQQPHGLYISQNPAEYVLFQGPSYAGRDALEDITFPGSGSFSCGGLNEIVFTQLSGSVPISGAITLDDHIHPVININLNNEGRIDEQ